MCHKNLNLAMTLPFLNISSSNYLFFSDKVHKGNTRVFKWPSFVKKDCFFRKSLNKMLAERSNFLVFALLFQVRPYLSQLMFTSCGFSARVEWWGDLCMLPVQPYQEGTDSKFTLPSITVKHNCSWEIQTRQTERGENSDIHVRSPVNSILLSSAHCFLV
jgi:hypothetical protein